MQGDIGTTGETNMAKEIHQPEEAKRVGELSGCDSDE